MAALFNRFLDLKQSRHKTKLFVPKFLRFRGYNGAGFETQVHEREPVCKACHSFYPRIRGGVSKDVLHFVT